jgi:hypothetical protein
MKRRIPPEKNTPSELTDNVLMIALWPPKLKKKAPSALLDVIPGRRTSSKGILCWVDGDRAYRLFIMSQRRHRFTRCQVP